MKNKLKKIFLISSLFLFIIVLAFSFVCSDIVKYSKTDEKKSCDVIIVLGAATYNGELSPVYRERVNHSIWLYDNDYADYIIFTGGIADGNTFSDAYAAKQYAIENGVPENVIFIEEVSTITEENLYEAKIIMDENLWATAIIVSDPLHMKRAMLMAEDYGITAVSSPTPTTMYQSTKTKLPFLLREAFFHIGYSVVRVFK